jgi:hypothetical protein
VASAVSTAFWGTSIVHHDFNSTELESFYSYPRRVGPIDLTQGTVTGLGDNEIPTVVNNLFSQGTITEPTLGVFFAPTTSESETNGELAFGTPDKGKCVGPINYTPITTTSPASEYWGINEEITYGGTVILETTAGIVDTGTTLVLIATSALLDHWRKHHLISSDT